MNPSGNGIINTRRIIDMNRPVNECNTNLRDATTELIDAIAEPLGAIQVSLLCVDIEVLNRQVDSRIVLRVGYTDEEYATFLYSLSSITEEDEPMGVAYFSDGIWAILLTPDSESTWDWYCMGTPEVPEYLMDRTLPIEDFDSWVVEQFVL